MLPRLWQCAERLPGLSSVLFGWQRMLGEEFGAVQKYLRPTDRLVSTLPCRVGCQPCCRRRVVRHGLGDCVAICDEGTAKYAVDETELISHELNMGTVCRDLCAALGFDSAPEPVAGLHQTWRLGYLAAGRGAHRPVYLSIQMEQDRLMEAAIGLCAASRTPPVLLLPTVSMMSERTRQVLDASHGDWLPLDRIVNWTAGGRMTADRKLAEMLVPVGHTETTKAAEPQPASIGEKITVERRELDDGVHWIVGGVDRGVLYARPSAIKARILSTLYDLIGRGWIPHATFMALTAWPEDAYFGSPTETGRMQKQLNYLRGKLGVLIEFKKNHGVRFAENIIQAR